MVENDDENSVTDESAKDSDTIENEADEVIENGKWIQ